MFEPLPSVPITTTAGDNLTIQCSASGYPPPTISWFKEQDQVMENTRITISAVAGGGSPPAVAVTSTVTIMGVQLQDAGSYSCLAGNDIANASRDIAQVTVVGE